MTSNWIQQGPSEYSKKILSKHINLGINIFKTNIDNGTRQVALDKLEHVEISKEHILRIVVNLGKLIDRSSRFDLKGCC